ncbi:MAG: 2-oxoacid:acceptor oxidoreductase family protein [Elusimicrobia bacterium]|nr:2-oxoacid:acceptor oxidoreductase family protein [Elusimicrobiota bacterium]
MEIRIAGFGGQGVMLAGNILGKAASIYGNKYATMTQSFGPEARGGYASSCLIISDEKILYPYLTKPDILVSMSQEAYTRYINDLKEGGTLIIEEELVKLEPEPKNVKIFKAPATRIAEQVGKKVVLNIVMVGFIAGITKILDKEVVLKAILDTVPKGTEDMNKKAFESGYEYAVKNLS